MDKFRDRSVQFTIHQVSRNGHYKEGKTSSVCLSVHVYLENQPYMHMRIDGNNMSAFCLCLCVCYSENSNHQVNTLAIEQCTPVLE